MIMLPKQMTHRIIYVRESLIGLELTLPGQYGTRENTDIHGSSLM
jgi:hypothetical protein